MSETDSRRDIEAALLLNGYAEIARAWITQPGGCRADDARRQVEDMLIGQWGLARQEARARSSHILRFWDEYAGVFLVARAAGTIKPRHRIFAEIGTAMWLASHNDAANRREWVRSAITDSDNREPAVLAAALSPDMAGELIEAAGQAPDPSARSRAVLWTVVAMDDGARPPTESLCTLIEALARAGAGSPEFEAQVLGTTLTKDTRLAPVPIGWRHGWPYVLLLAKLSLPAALRPRRDRLLAGLALDADERMTIDALTALADAAADASATLEPAQEAAVRRFLLSTTAVFHISNGRELDWAARYAAQLGPEAAESILLRARYGSKDRRDRIQRQLAPLGYSASESAEAYPGSAGFAGEADEAPTDSLDEPEEWKQRRQKEWEYFFAAAVPLAPPCPLTAAGRWRLPELARLYDVLSADWASTGHISAVEGPLLSGCIRAAAHAAGLDLSAISAEAAIAAKTLSADSMEAVDVISAPPPDPPPTCDTSRLDHQDTDTLLQALGAESEWLSDIACNLLRIACDPAIGLRAADRIPQVPPNRRANAAVVAIANNPDPPVAATRLLQAEDALVRAGAAFAARILSKDSRSTAWAFPLSLAQADSDLTVQGAGGNDIRRAKATNATHWSCEDCGYGNEIDVYWCAACKKGGRPISSEFSRWNLRSQGITYISRVIQ